MQDVINHPEYLWEWDKTITNPNFNITVINQYPEKQWNWSAISCCGNITMQDVINHPEYPWNFYRLSDNSQFSMEVVYKYPNTV